MNRAKANRDLDRVWQLMAGLVMDSRGDWRRKVAEVTGLPFTRVRALWRLAEGERTLAELAASMGTDAPAATVIVNDLEERGLVERRVHPDDRRARLVSITAAGKKLLHAASAVTDRAPQSIAKLGAADVKELLRILGPLARK